MLVDPGIQSDKRGLPTLPTLPLGLLSDGVMSWKVSPPKFLCGSSHVTPGSQNVTSFSRRVFAEVVRLKQGCHFTLTATRWAHERMRGPSSEFCPQLRLRCSQGSLRPLCFLSCLIHKSQPCPRYIVIGSRDTLKFTSLFPIAFPPIPSKSAQSFANVRHSTNRR